MVVTGFLLFVAIFWEFVIRIVDAAVVVAGIVVKRHANVAVFNSRRADVVP